MGTQGMGIEMHPFKREMEQLKGKAQPKAKGRVMVITDPPPRLEHTDPLTFVGNKEVGVVATQLGGGNLYSMVLGQ